MSNFVDLFNEESIKDKIDKKIDEKKNKKLSKKDDKSESCCKESFHFGPSFNSDYLNYALSEAEDNSCLESTYDGSDINNDEDPTEPSVDDIVNTEPDLSANYHFGPSFGQDVFTKSTLKHSRK